MSIIFTSKEEFFTFHDPMQEGKCIDRKTELRFDPLTGESARLIYDPGAPFVTKDYAAIAKETEGSRCPFCEENVSISTPRFPDELIEGGRLFHGEAVVFPNLFPYSKHNAVVRMCKQHYVKMNEFHDSMMTQAFEAAHLYTQKVLAFDEAAQFISFNWNYFPPSGGSILHPHLHVLISEQPTNYQSTHQRKSEDFFKKTKTCYFEELVRTEKQLEQRWIAQVEMIDWIHAFAPKGHHDFIGVLPVQTIHDLTTAHYQALAKSMVSFLTFFQTIGVGSFNLALFAPLNRTKADRVHVRLLPRMTIGMLDTSDMNVFNYLHNEPLVLKRPEQVTKEVALYFKNYTEK